MAVSDPQSGPLDMGGGRGQAGNCADYPRAPRHCRQEWGGGPVALPGRGSEAGGEGGVGG